MRKALCQFFLQNVPSFDVLKIFYYACALRRGVIWKLKAHFDDGTKLIIFV